MKSAPLRAAMAGIAMAITLAACGSDATTTAPTTGELTVVDSMGNEVTLEATATTIVSLSPTATESLFAIGAGDQVVAVDEFSYYPEEAPVTDLSGYTPNAEAVAAYEPDLVVISNDANDLVAQLTTLDIPTLIQAPAVGFDDVYDQIEDLGVLTGHTDEAGVLTTDMREAIAKEVANAPAEAAGLTYFHEVSTDYYTTSSTSFIGTVYGLFDLVNIADEAAEAAGSEFPQMAEEAILTADPQLVFTTSGATPEDVVARPGWADVDAVVNDDVVMLPADIPSRWGPRVVDFVQVIGDSLDDVADTE